MHEFSVSGIKVFDFAAYDIIIRGAFQIHQQIFPVLAAPPPFLNLASAQH